MVVEFEKKALVKTPLDDAAAVTAGGSSVRVDVEKQDEEEDVVWARMAVLEMMEPVTDTVTGTLGGS